MNKTKLTGLVVLLVVSVGVAFYFLYQGGGEARFGRLSNSSERFIEVSGTQGTWVDTGVDLVVGRSYAVEVNGEICFYDAADGCYGGNASVGAGGFCVGQDCSNDVYYNIFYGKDTDSRDTYLYQPHASLLLKQGEGNDLSRVFKAIDGFPNGKAEYVGNLYVLVNDWRAGDNTGSFTLKITTYYNPVATN